LQGGKEMAIENALVSIELLAYLFWPVELLANNGKRLTAVTTV